MDNTLRKGLALIERGDYKPVHQIAIDLIHQNTENPVPYFLLARVAHDHQNYKKADELYRRASELEPDNPLYISSYGQYLVGVGRQQPALVCADKAAELPISDAFVADIVGVIYSRTGFHEKAVPFFKEAVRLNPAPANFHYNLGASLQFSGDFAGAEAAYRDTIERQPDAYRAHSSLVSLSRQTPGNNLLTELKDRFAENESDPDASLHLGHAIAKTLEDLDKYPDSLEWLTRAKRLKRKMLDYDIEQDLRLFDAAAQTLRGAVTHSDQHAEVAPIFIIGMPRTGTTLVDRILSSHADVVSAGELNTFAGLTKSLAKTPSNMVLDVETLNNVIDLDLGELGHNYIEATRTLARGSARFTDKMPLNFFYAGLIHKALPNARIVALRRDPMDSCLSNYRQLFSTAFSYYNYSLDLDDTATYYKAFDKLLAHWRDALPEDRFTEVHYEDIVHAQEKETRRLLSFCDLPWDEACLRFHENAAPVSTASSVQVRQPLYSGSIGRWRKYGDSLKELRNQLGILN
jgi:tetratricopeptide (TPR) repeat protein